MLDLGKKGEFPDAKQRAAVCHSQFNKGRSKASATTGENDEEMLFFNVAAEDPSLRYKTTKEEALQDARKMGLKGFHTHQTEEGKILYMAGPNHKAFLKRHKEILKEK